MSRNVSFSAICFIVVFCAAALAAYPCPYDGPAENLNETRFQVENYNIDIRVVFPQDPDEGFIEGSCTLDCISKTDNLTILDLDFYKDENAQVNSVTVHGSPASYSFENDLVSIQLPGSLNTGDTATVVVEYRAAGLDHFKFLPKPPKTVLYGYNAMVEASRWFPCLHDPTDKALYEFQITTADTMMAACNGTLESNVDNGDGTRTMTWVEHSPMATYLATVNVSEYVTFGHQWNSIPVEYYVRSESLAAAEFDFQNDDAILDFYDETFGPYPFEKMGLAQVKLAGAMENQDMISYGLISGDLNHEDTFAHEISHMYWGDSITLKGCEEVWLNEGFASYCEALWEEHFYGDTQYDAVMADFKQRYFDEDAQHRFSIYDPEDVWSNTTYRKGAWVLHMLRRITGDTVFFNIMHEYYDRYQFTHATIPEFKGVCEELYGQPLDWFFQEWLYMAGYPELTVRSVYENQTMHLFVEQTQLNAPIFKMPVSIQLDSSEKQNLMLETGLDYIAIPTSTEPATITLDPDNSLLCTKQTGNYSPGVSCTITMPSDMLTSGDICWCRVYVDNMFTSPLENCPLFVILDVFGELFFAPDFSSYDNYSDIYTQFDPGRTIVNVLPEFTWPENVGSASGLVWYAALTNAEMTALFGEMDIFTFGWE